MADSIENAYAKNKYRAEMFTFLKSIICRKIEPNFNNVKPTDIFMHTSNKAFCSIHKHKLIQIDILLLSMLSLLLLMQHFFIAIFTTLKLQFLL